MVDRVGTCEHCSGPILSFRCSHYTRTDEHTDCHWLQIACALAFFCGLYGAV